jgi:hypothetical protein
MGYAAMKKLDGFLAMGGEVPNIDPAEIVIVGLDTPETPENWFAHCARVKDISYEEIRAYAESMVAAGRVDHIVKVYRDGDRLVALDGRTTTRGAREAREIQAERKVRLDERVSVRVVIFRGDPDELYRVNLDSHKHRPLTRTQYAKGVLTYYQRVGEDVAKTAAFFKTSLPTIKTLLAHFDLSAAVQKAIDAKEVPATVTNQLAKLPRAQQDETLAEMKANDATKGAAATDAVKKAARGQKITRGVVLRARPKRFLAKWSVELEKDEFNDLAQTIRFLLGGPLPDKFKDNEKIMMTLERAGFVEKTKKAQKVKRTKSDKNEKAS